jgi:integrase
MASVKRRADTGEWEVRWRVLEVIRNADGTETRKWLSRRRGCPDKRTADALALQVEQKAALGERWEPETEQARPTLDTVLAHYLDDRKRMLRGRTAEQYAHSLDLFRRFVAQTCPPPHFPDLLSRDLLGAYHAWLVAGHGRVPPHDRPTQRVSTAPRTPETARKNVEVVQLAWAWAADDDRYADAVPRPRTIEMPKGATTPARAPSWAEMDRCVQAATGWQRKLAIVQRYTGLRCSTQCMQLRWRDVDLDHATLTIRGELGKSDQERLGRIVPISRHLVEELRTWERVDATDGDEWLIPSGRKPGPREREARGRDLARAWKRAGVPEDRWKRHPDHAFRKGITSNLKRAGADPEAAEFIVGHAIPGVRSAYLDPDYLPSREAVALIPKIGESVEQVPRLRVVAG